MDIEESTSKAYQLLSCINDPENFIYEYFNAIRRKVDLRREALKVTIDEYSNELIMKINEIEPTCKHMAYRMTELTNELHRIENDLNQLIRGHNCSMYRQCGLTKLHSNFNETFQRYKEFLIGYNDYEFIIRDIDMNNIFGSFIGLPVVMFFCLFHME